MDLNKNRWEAKGSELKSECSTSEARKKALRGAVSNINLRVVPNTRFVFGRSCLGRFPWIAYPHHIAGNKPNRIGIKEMQSNPFLELSYKFCRIVLDVRSNYSMILLRRIFVVMAWPLASRLKEKGIAWARWGTTRLTSAQRTRLSIIHCKWLLTERHLNSFSSIIKRSIHISLYAFRLSSVPTRVVTA